MSENSHSRPVQMLVQTRWSVSYKGRPIGLISPERTCAARFRLPAGYSVAPYHGSVDGPGWLTLKVGPETSLALAALGVTIGTIDFDRPVRLSSRFPRWIEIRRVSTSGCATPASVARASPSLETPSSPWRSRSHFAASCDPRPPVGRGGDDGHAIGGPSRETPPRDRSRTANAGPNRVGSGLA